MKIQGLLGTKIEQTKTFTPKGERIPVTKIMLGPTRVVAILPQPNREYQIIRVGFGLAKNSNKPTLGQIKGAGLTTAPHFFKEFKTDLEGNLTLGQEIKAADVFGVGDKVKVSGVSKGKGFAGVVKRYGFHGGPKTHGQSDRHRAPGSSGSTTTPGRVYRGHRMGGRMGGVKVTILGLKVVALDNEKNEILISGLVPGPIGGLVSIIKESS
ncbi:50S ribosomal protein L3 [Candidatus Gottesmanbacteria bacterium]|nr:50S ribosomal protein L3 [Candidatus Gottesmanbacteria bacterium]